jgi:hypothetical protein
LDDVQKGDSHIKIIISEERKEGLVLIPLAASNILWTGKLLIEFSCMKLHKLNDGFMGRPSRLFLGPKSKSHKQEA